MSRIVSYETNVTNCNVTNCLYPGKRVLRTVVLNRETHDEIVRVEALLVCTVVHISRALVDREKEDPDLS